MAASLMEAVFDYQQQAATVSQTMSLPVAGRSNFNTLEKEIIQQLVYKYRDVLAFRKNDHNTVMNKKKCWTLIELEYNSKGLVTKRTAKQLRKCWENLKARTKKAAHDAMLTLDDDVTFLPVDVGHRHQQQPHHLPTIVRQGDSNTSVGSSDPQQRRRQHYHPRARSPGHRPFRLFTVPVSLHEDEGEVLEEVVEEEEDGGDDEDVYSAGTSEPETNITIIPDVEEVLKQEPVSPAAHIQYRPDTPEEGVSTSEHSGYLQVSMGRTVGRSHPLVVVHETMSSTSQPVCDTSELPVQLSMNLPFDFGPANKQNVTATNPEESPPRQPTGPHQEEEHRLRMIVLRQRKLHEEQQHEAKMAEHSAAMAVYTLQREYWAQMLRNIPGQS